MEVRITVTSLRPPRVVRVCRWVIRTSKALVTICRKAPETVAEATAQKLSFFRYVASRPECNRIHRARESWALSWHCLDFIFVLRLETSVTISGSSVIPELYVCDESSVGRPSVPEGGSRKSGSIRVVRGEQFVASCIRDGCRNLGTLANSSARHEVGRMGLVPLQYLSFKEMTDSILWGMNRALYWPQKKGTG